MLESPNPPGEAHTFALISQDALLEAQAFLWGSLACGGMVLLLLLRGVTWISSWSWGGGGRGEEMDGFY